MDFILPIILWQKVGKHSLIVSCGNWAIVILYSIIALAGEERSKVSWRGPTPCLRSLHYSFYAALKNKTTCTVTLSWEFAAVLSILL